MTENRPCSNNHPCTCPNTNCPRHGRCCDCVAHHRDDVGNIPNCFRVAGINAVKEEPAD
ncbi:MAG: hypothetical protein IIZ27_08510 [Solobacterium sp.]|nr:hypothetical protein [Solobacterium sp.]MBR2668327.1 hypothetical protein [Solobacterium sp.]